MEKTETYQTAPGIRQRDNHIPVVFENRAWSESRYGRWVSSRVPIDSVLNMNFDKDAKKSVVFEIGYHHVMKKYFVDFNWYTYESKEASLGMGRGDACYGGPMQFFDTFWEAFKWLSTMGYNVQIQTQYIDSFIRERDSDFSVHKELKEIQ